MVGMVARPLVAVAAGLAAGLGAARAGAGVAPYLVALVSVAVLVAQLLARRGGRPGWPSSLVAVGLVLVVGGPRPLAFGLDPDRAGQDLVRPDGTRLAYEVHGGPVASGTVPVVFVHGGPGVATRSRDRLALAPIARQHALVLYDQVGTGASSRLGDPLDYTLDRALDDLDALRGELRVGSMVLVGHSWGATVAAHYAARHPDAVEALVLAAPGDPDFAADIPDDPSVRLAPRDRAALFARLLRPRELFSYMLTVSDVPLAHAVAGDEEMDRRFAAVLARTAPALFCDPSLASTYPTDGAGYYAHQVPQVHRPTPPPVRPVEGVATLVVKPDCDYLPWSVVDDYVEAFGARVVRFPDAGHALHVERPEPFARLVEAFLAGEPLTGELHAPSTPPPEFDGPE